MTILSEVQSWMRFWGWSAGGEPGSIKRDANGAVIARHGDQTWKADVERAFNDECRRRERSRCRFAQSHIGVQT